MPHSLKDTNFKRSKSPALFVAADASDTQPIVPSPATFLHILGERVRFIAWCSPFEHPRERIGDQTAPFPLSSS